MMKSEIEQILKELSKEFSTKTTALLEARKVFVSFDPDGLRVFLKKEIQAQVENL